MHREPGLRLVAMGSCGLAVAIAVFGPAAAAKDQRPKDSDVLWSVGVPDNSPAELGLTDVGYAGYRQRYPEPIVFTVGQSRPSDWPYVHPSTRDAWAGSQPHTLTIKFPSPRDEARPLYLKLGLLGVGKPSRITITVNGRQIAAQRLPAHTQSHGLINRPTGEGETLPLVITIPAGTVSAGENALGITLQDGSWMIYDYVQLGSRQQPPAAGLEDQDLVKEFLAGPMAGVEEIVFAVHSVIHEHWYANIGYFSTDRRRIMSGKHGKLCKLNVRTGQVTVLLEDDEGSMRDPCVHYDGRRILFAYRKGGTENYRLYTINADGTGLRPITAGAYDDYEPCWLPDGGIVFVTTRANRWVNCWLTQVGTIWRCDADGRNMRALSANLEHDNTPWVLPDGRLLYMRWEYVDRSQVTFHHLWTMYPDGTGQTVFFGNLHPGGVFIDAKPIPGSDDILLIHSPGHGATEHEGYVARVSVKRGPDELGSLRNISRQVGYRDPWAFGADAFMAARQNQLVLMNGRGQTATLLTLPKDFGPVWLHEPRPLVARPPESVIPSRADLSQPTGTFVLDNVYHGRNMAGVPPGEIKRLLVIESLPKPINFTGGMDPLSYKGTFTLERVLGTVPVEADGSAHFLAPANRSLFFVAVDEDSRAVKRMQSFTTVQPGETLGCVGCHEQRTKTRPPRGPALTQAARRRASVIEPLRDLPDVPDFPRDIQPILDRHCVKCHDYSRRDGGVVLTGDRGPMFSHSYYTLTVWHQIADGRNEPRSNYAPRTLGSGGSPLMDKLDSRHYEVQLAERERRTVQLWLDLGAPYPGTYAALGTGSIGGYIQNQQVLNNDSNWAETQAAQPVFASRCVSCHDRKQHPVAQSLCDEIGLSFWSPAMTDPRLKYARHVVYNLSRPEQSLILLAPLSRSAGGYGLCKPAGAAADKWREVSLRLRQVEPDPGKCCCIEACADYDAVHEVWSIT